MPNHGYCKNCWWWKPKDDIKGICYMQSYCSFTKETSSNSYCPDYLNRKKGNQEGILEKYINSLA